jgi:hypothetical protein
MPFTEEKQPDTVPLPEPATQLTPQPDEPTDDELHQYLPGFGCIGE